MLKDVQHMFSNRSIHPEFLEAGLLKTLRAWVSLLPDGSLPNLAVRTAVLQILQSLAIDTGLPGRQALLAESKIGPVSL